MTEELFARAGVCSVLTDDLNRSDAADFKEQVQLGVLRRIQKAGGPVALNRIELVGESGSPVTARVFGYMSAKLGQGPTAKLEAATPSDLGELVYRWLCTR